MTTDWEMGLGCPSQESLVFQRKLAHMPKRVCLQFKSESRGFFAGFCLARWSRLNCFCKARQPALKYNAVKWEVLLRKVRQTSLRRRRVSSFFPAMFATKPCLWLVKDLLSQQRSRIWDGKVLDPTQRGLGKRASKEITSLSLSLSV